MRLASQKNVLQNSSHTEIRKELQVVCKYVATCLAYHSFEYCALLPFIGIIDTSNSCRNTNINMSKVHTQQVVFAVPVGASGYYSEFLLADSNAYIKTTFAPSKKHYTEIEKAKQNMQTSFVPQQQQTTSAQARPIRTRITLAEILNPE